MYPQVYSLKMKLMTMELVSCSTGATSSVRVTDTDALAGLPESQRLALTLCHYQGLRNSEAATVMGVSVEALESLLARGRRAAPLCPSGQFA